MTEKTSAVGERAGRTKEDLAKRSLAWAIALTQLLDRIEAADTLEEVGTLSRQRFPIAEAHGATVVFTGEKASSNSH